MMINFCSNTEPMQTNGVSLDLFKSHNRQTEGSSPSRPTIFTLSWHCQGKYHNMAIWPLYGIFFTIIWPTLFVTVLKLQPVTDFQRIVLNAPVHHKTVIGEILPNTERTGKADL